MQIVHRVEPFEHMIAIIKLQSVFAIYFIIQSSGKPYSVQFQLSITSGIIERFGISKRLQFQLFDSITNCQFASQIIVWFAAVPFICALEAFNKGKSEIADWIFPVQVKIISVSCLSWIQEICQISISDTSFKHRMKLIVHFCNAQQPLSRMKVWSGA